MSDLKEVSLSDESSQAQNEAQVDLELQAQPTPPLPPPPPRTRNHPIKEAAPSKTGAGKGPSHGALISRPTGRPPLLPERLPRIIELAAEGWTREEIAQELGMTRNALRVLLYKARQQGQLLDSEDRVVHQAVPLAIDNLINLLEKGDKHTTHEMLKGVGIWKSHAQTKNEGQTGPVVLAVKFEIPEGSQPKTIEGSIVGRPVGELTK